MNHNNYLARNLESYRILNNLSMHRFAAKAGIPLSTLRAIMKEGNTTMDTVLRISNSLNISLDVLVRSEKPDFGLPATAANKINNQNVEQVSSEQLLSDDSRNYIKKTDRWFGDFSSEKRTEISDLIAEIWNVIDK